MLPHRITFPPGRHMSPSQNPETNHSLHWPSTTLLPCLLRPHRAFRIYNATPLPPPKSILTYHSATSWPLFSATMATRASSLPCSLSPCHKPPILVAMSPTPALLPAAYQFMLLGTCFSVYLGPSLLPHIVRSHPTATLPSVTLSDL